MDSEEPVTPSPGTGFTDASAAVLDEPELLERFGGDGSLLHEVIEVFLAECPVMIGDVRAALDRADHEGVFRSAHKLKGSVASLSAHRARRAALALEKMGEAGALENGEEAFDVLADEMVRLQRALAEFIARGR
jgi:HPt (histidine-containing phosphotransfer) domain-containing protein